VWRYNKVSNASQLGKTVYHERWDGMLGPGIKRTDLHKYTSKLVLLERR